MAIVVPFLALLIVVCGALAIHFTRRKPKQIVPPKTRLDLLIDRYMAADNADVTASVDFILEAEEMDDPFAHVEEVEIRKQSWQEKRPFIQPKPLAPSYVYGTPIDRTRWALYDARNKEILNECRNEQECLECARQWKAKGYRVEIQGPGVTQAYEVINDLARFYSQAVVSKLDEISKVYAVPPHQMEDPRVRRYRQLGMSNTEIEEVLRPSRPRLPSPTLPVGTQTLVSS